MLYREATGILTVWTIHKSPFLRGGLIDMMLSDRRFDFRLHLELSLKVLHLGIKIDTIETIYIYIQKDLRKQRGISFMGRLLSISNSK